MRVHFSIDVPDLDEGTRFYSSVFALEEIARPFPTMAVLQAENATVCVHEKPAGTPASSQCDEPRRYTRHWTPVHLDLHVEDFDDALQRLEAAGGTVEEIHKPDDHPPAAFCSDPFGHGFCVIGQRAEEAT